MSGEKTEKPTARRRKESRKEGQVPRTQELGAWAAVLLFVLALRPLVSHELGALIALFKQATEIIGHPTAAGALTLLQDGMTHAFLTLIMLSAGVMVVGVASALAQGGFYLATKAVKPKFSKLNPIKGAKRIFGPHGLWEGVKMLVKSTIVALLGYVAVRSVMPLIGGFVPTGTVLRVVFSGVTGLMRNIALAALLMAGADYAFQRRRVGKQVRMSKDEVKQEFKQQEGDPLVKSAIRSRQLAMARQRMMADVPTADVVLVNPTHIAIALRYAPEKGAPQVVARGAGVVAARIREKAAEHRITVVRDVPLARALYSSCKVGQEIPRELFAAVAQVLAYVISRRARGFSGGDLDSPRTDEAPLPTVTSADRRRARIADRSSGAASGR
jgi:flagellar biosynthetic protein FlhB